ncbi:hypothetical protein ACPPVO_43800 [Dactylosporangium sp. McL0621]|uniref:hypothetical protein n=1 Tax=Dactylosporangium sp. McL0621 TaxID=3415678 RepID=UPI003CF598F0
MRAVAVRNLPAGLLYEPTWDGFRALAWVLDDRVLLQSRQMRNLSPYFPDVTRLLCCLAVGVTRHRCTDDSAFVDGTQSWTTPA